MIARDPAEPVQAPEAATSQDTGAKPTEEAVAIAAGEAAAAETRAVEEDTASSDMVAAPMPRLPEDADDATVGRVAAALIFASDRPVTAARLSDLLRQPAGKIRSGVAAWNEVLQSVAAPFSIVEIAGGYRFLTDPSLAAYVAALRGAQKKEKLSSAALETLAIVAYRQPVTKGEIEAVRGVQASPILRGLLERGFIKITGRAPVPGRPLQYGTTREFLDRFSLGSIKDLPTVEELGK